MFPEPSSVAEEESRKRVSMNFEKDTTCKKAVSRHRVPERKSLSSPLKKSLEMKPIMNNSSQRSQHSQPIMNKASQLSQHAQPIANKASQRSEHAQSIANKASQRSQHAQPIANKVSQRSQGAQPIMNKASQCSQHAQPIVNKASQRSQHAQPIANKMSQRSEHAQPIMNKASQLSQRAQPIANKASQRSEHAQSIANQASQRSQHAQPIANKVSQRSQDAQPIMNKASQCSRHAQPIMNKASQRSQHAQPIMNKMSQRSQHLEREATAPVQETRDPDSSMHIDLFISDNSSNRDTNIPLSESASVYGSLLLMESSDLLADSASLIGIESLLDLMGRYASECADEFLKHKSVKSFHSCLDMAEKKVTSCFNTGCMHENDWNYTCSPRRHKDKADVNKISLEDLGSFEKVPTWIPTRSVTNKNKTSAKSKPFMVPAVVNASMPREQSRIKLSTSTSKTDTMRAVSRHRIAKCESHPFRLKTLIGMR